MVKRDPIKSCFSIGAAAAGGAGAESYVELWNAATTGVTAHINRVVIISAEDGAGTVVKMKYHTAQQGSGGASHSAANAAVGQAAPGCAVYGSSAASVSGTQFGGLIITTNTRTEYEFKEPIKVRPGLSFILESTTAQKAVTMCQIEWDEVPTNLGLTKPIV